MKKLYILFSFILFSVALSAQISVTYKVDVSLYDDTVAISPDGMGIGGNFDDLDGVNSLVGDTVPNWTPSSVEAAMTDEGNGVWSITITYPSSAIGTEQLFKFVNGDWGTNEGLGPTSTIATDGCGVDDGAGNINRTLIIPDASVAYQWCWDNCTKCDGSDPLLGVETISSEVFDLNNYPNPASTSTTISYYLNQPASDLTLTVYNSLGQVLNQMEKSSQGTGLQEYTLNTSSFPSNVYFYSLYVDGKLATGKMVVAR